MTLSRKETSSARVPSPFPREESRKGPIRFPMSVFKHTELKLTQGQAFSGGQCPVSRVLQITILYCHKADDYLVKFMNLKYFLLAAYALCVPHIRFLFRLSWDSKADTCRRPHTHVRTYTPLACSVASLTEDKLRENAVRRSGTKKQCECAVRCSNQERCPLSPMWTMRECSVLSLFFGEVADGRAEQWS